MFFSALRQRVEGTQPARRRRRSVEPGRRRAGCRPQLEALEVRLAPASMRFSNLAGGDWGTDANWTNTALATDHHVPIAADDAIIDPQNIAVTYTGTAADSVHSLTLSGPNSRLNFESGLLRVTTTLQASNNFTLAVDGGQLSALTTVTGSASNVVVNSGGLLMAEGAITLGSSSTVTINNGGRLTAQTTFAASGGTVTVNGGGTLTANGPITVNNAGTVHLNGGSLSAFAGISVTGSGTLTLDGGTLAVPSPGVITVNGGRLNDNLGPLTNLGTLVNATLSIGVANSGTFVCQGTCTLVGDNPAGSFLGVQAVGGGAVLNVAGGATNAGTIQLYVNVNGANAALAIGGGTPFVNAPGGVIRADYVGGNGGATVSGNLTNQGAINANSVFLGISGSLTNQDGGSINAGTNANLPISAAFAEAGGTMTGNAYLASQSFRVTASPPTGQGSVQLRGTCTLLGDNLANTLLDVQAFGAPAQLNVSDGATNFGTIRLNVSGNSDASLNVTGSGTLINAAGGFLNSARPSGGGTSRVNGELLNAGTVTLLSAPLTVTGNSFTNQPGGVVLGDGTLDVSGSGAAPFTNYGTVRVPAGNTLVIHGTFTNFSTLDRRLSGGTYEVTGTLRFDSASLVTLDANLLLDGAGGSGGQVLPTVGGSDALAGLAAITPSGSLTVRNGRLIGTTAAPLPALRNDGTLAVGNASTLIVGTYTQGAAALLDINGGRLRVQTAFTNFAGGTLTGGVYRLTGTDSAHHGTLQFAGADLTTNAAAIELNGPNAEILDTTNPTPIDRLRTLAVNNGSFTVQNGASFTTGGDFSNNGTLTVGAGSTFLVGGNLTNFSAGTLTGGTYILAGTLQFAGADIRTNAATLVLDGTGGRILDTSATPLDGLRNFAVNDSAGSFTVRNGRNRTTGDFTNNGNLIVGAGSVFTVSGNLTNFDGTTLTGGTYRVSGTFRFTGANIQANAATVVLDGTSAAITDQFGGNALVNFTANAAGGSFTLQNGRNLTLGTLANAGALTVGSGSTLTVTGAYTQSSGTTTIGGGATLAADTFTANGGGITLSSGGMLVVANGVNLAQGSTLDGSGTIVGDVTNAGVINVGGAGSAGTLVITGNLTQTATGSLNFEIGGYGPGTDYDVLMVGGQATLDGTLHVGLLGDFNPNPGDSFQIMVFDTTVAVGLFVNVSLPPGGTIAAPFDGTANF